MKKLLVVLGIALIAGKGWAQDSMRVEKAKAFIHERVKEGGVSLELRGIYLNRGLLWLSFRARNRSPIDFRVDWVSFSIRERRLLRRMALQEIRVSPLAGSGPTQIPSDAAVNFFYGFRPRVLSAEKELMVELRERDGDRRLRMGVSAKLLLRARKLP